MSQVFDNNEELSALGLNLQAVVNLATIPDEVRATLEAQCPDISPFRQLILIGHGGTRLWDMVSETGMAGDDPIDCFSRDRVAAYLEASPQCGAYRFLFPLLGSTPPLMTLGALVGWHHPPPFMLGINAAWGSWFAYRALVLADSDFACTEPEVWPSPCEACADKPCMRACPAGAISVDGFRAEGCFSHRLSDGSSCAQTCLARAACPIGAGHRYGPAQMRYHYRRSLESLKAYAEDEN